MSSTSNVNSSEIDKETEEKLKGDLIGSTSYSESFVLKTLLKLKKLEWNGEFENDLCFLWDMTVEADVCHYLYKVNFPSIASDIVTKDSQARLIEILIGILGNISIPSDVPKLNIEVFNSVLTHLSSKDPLIVIQVMRLIQVNAHKKYIDFVTECVIEKIAFILNNSNNDDLIVATLDALCKITNDCQCDVNLLKCRLVRVATEGFRTICTHYVDPDINFFKVAHVKPALNHYLQFVINISSYVNQSQNENFLSRFEICDIDAEFIKVIFVYVQDDELPFSTEELNFIIETIGFVSPIMGLKNEILLNCLMDLFLLLTDVPLKKELLEVICYYMSAADVIEVRNKEKYRDIFNDLRGNNVKSEYDYKKNLDVLIAALV